MGRDPIKPLIYGIVPFMLAAFLLLMLPSELTYIGYIAEAVVSISIGYAIAADKTLEMEEALQNGARAFERQREVMHNPQSRTSEKAQKAQMKAREASEPFVTHPQRFEDEDAGNSPQKQSKKVKK